MPWALLFVSSADYKLLDIPNEVHEAFMAYAKGSFILSLQFQRWLCCSTADLTDIVFKLIT